MCGDVVTVLKREGVCTIAVTTELGPAVPYPAVQHEDGTRNNGFVDLIEHPEVIDRLPELQGRPGFTKLVRTINRPDSALMPLGCEAGFFQIENPSPDGPTCYVGNYVDIAYRDVAFGTEHNLVSLAERIIDLRAPKESEWTSYEFYIQKMPHLFGRPSFNLMLKILSHGRNEAEAWEIFNIQCKMMSKTFETIK